MSDKTLNFETIIPKFDAILSRGLSFGVGDREGQMCIGAAICAAMDLPYYRYNPSCVEPVEPVIRSYNIDLNDKKWTSPKARAKGLRNLGIAQIGSNGVVDGHEFAKRLAKRTIQVLLPEMLRSIPRLADARLLELAKVCEQEGTFQAAIKLRNALAGFTYDAADAAAPACTAYAAASCTAHAADACTGAVSAADAAAGAVSAASAPLGAAAWAAAA